MTNLIALPRVNTTGRRRQEEMARHSLNSYSAHFLTVEFVDIVARHGGLFSLQEFGRVSPAAGAGETPFEEPFLGTDFVETVLTW